MITTVTCKTCDKVLAMWVGPCEPFNLDIAEMIHHHIVADKHEVVLTQKEYET